MSAIKTPKKLIEVALPLDAINIASVREKSIRHGHPSTLHLWWARRPLAAARAVIFAQMVNDPGYERGLGRGMNKEKAKLERNRLFQIIQKLVQWENTSNESVLAEARAEIWKSWRETCELNRGHPDAKTLFNPDVLPAFHDPFAGGGSLPLEAQRLGLLSYATDLNPVAVLINKALIEIPPRFDGVSPVGPSADSQEQIQDEWPNARGLGEDVRRYGNWVRERAFERIGRFYPNVSLPKEYGGGEATVIAWIWARTVKSPNPAFSHVDVPLASTFVLSKMVKNPAYVVPILGGDDYRFEVRAGTPSEAAKNGTKSGGSGSSFLCLMSQTPMDFKYLREEAKAGRMGQRLMAVVVDGPKGRIYLSPTPEHDALARTANPDWKPETSLPAKALSFRVQEYGMLKWSELFTSRQLLALTTFSDLIKEVRDQVLTDAIKNGQPDDGVRLEAGGRGAHAYADAIAVYLAFVVSSLSDRMSTLCTWDAGGATWGTKTRNTFSRQALAMTWDFAEVNPFSSQSGSFQNSIDYSSKGIGSVSKLPGVASQADASAQSISRGKVVSTDPPYYDNIGYADLSDFFYVWLRPSLRTIYPEILSTMAVPKEEELVATPHRHGTKEKAEKFFLNGMTDAMSSIATQAHPSFPTTIYYAFKQSDTTDLGTGNTGWETFLEAVLRAGFSITGTWPMRTELANRMVGSGTNALASSIVLVCRQRSSDAPAASRRDFLRELKEELGEAVEAMIGGAEGISPVAPVDLAQAVIGPGMGIFSKYSSVLEADGSTMTVHTALTLINRMLTEGADEFDADTQFCLGWFDDQGWAAGEFGKADVLARAKGTSVDHVREAGVVESSSGKVRLLKPADYAPDWSPAKDNNTPVWEALHQMVRALRDRGESAAGALLADMPQRAEHIRNLAYRLYTLCERKGWAEDARPYNELITSWTGVEAASHEQGHLGSQTNFEM
jgi:putative DNA methylase